MQTFEKWMQVIVAALAVDFAEGENNEGVRVGQVCAVEALRYECCDRSQHIAAAGGAAGSRSSRPPPSQHLGRRGLHPSTISEPHAMIRLACPLPTCWVLGEVHGLVLLRSNGLGALGPSWLVSFGIAGERVGFE